MVPHNKLGNASNIEAYHSTYNNFRSFVCQLMQKYKLMVTNMVK